MKARRQVLTASKALETMDAAQPTDAEREALRTVLAELGTDTSRSYSIGLREPPTYRIDVGRLHIHFRVSGGRLEVGFIGVYAQPFGVALGVTSNPASDFRPFEIRGEPLSTTILRERR